MPGSKQNRFQKLGSHGQGLLIRVDATQGDTGDSRERNFSFPQLLQVAPTESDMGGRPVDSINETKKDLERQKVVMRVPQSAREDKDQVLDITLC